MYDFAMQIECSVDIEAEFDDSFEMLNEGAGAADGVRLIGHTDQWSDICELRITAQLVGKAASRSDASAMANLAAEAIRNRATPEHDSKSLIRGTTFVESILEAAKHSAPIPEMRYRDAEEDDGAGTETAGDAAFRIAIRWTGALDHGVNSLADGCCDRIQEALRQHAGDIEVLCIEPEDQHAELEVVVYADCRADTADAAETVAGRVATKVGGRSWDCTVTSVGRFTAEVKQVDYRNLDDVPPDIMMQNIGAPRLMPLDAPC